MKLTNEQARKFPNSQKVWGFIPTNCFIGMPQRVSPFGVSVRTSLMLCARRTGIARYHFRANIARRRVRTFLPLSILFGMESWATTGQHLDTVPLKERDMDCQRSEKQVPESYRKDPILSMTPDKRKRKNPHLKGFILLSAFVFPNTYYCLSIIPAIDRQGDLKQLL